MAAASSEEFRKFIEVEVLSIIKMLLEKGETPQDRIQTMAKRTLELIQPSLSLDVLYQNAVKLDDEYQELAPVVMKIMKEYEEKYAMQAVSAVSALIKQGKYTDAQEMVKKVLQFKMVQ